MESGTPLARRSICCHPSVGSTGVAHAFSTTLRAHELGRTHDWVVVYYRRGGVSGLCTVVTARRGRLLDLRVIRGRESECLRYYEQRRAA